MHNICRESFGLILRRMMTTSNVISGMGIIIKSIIIPYPLFYEWHEILMNFQDIHENKIVNFPQIQCLITTFKNNFVNLLKTKSQKSFWWRLITKACIYVHGVAMIIELTVTVLWTQDNHWCYNFFFDIIIFYHTISQLSNPIRFLILLWYL